MQKTAAKDRPKTNPRITIEVTDEQYTLLKKHLEYGMQRRVFAVFVEDLVTLLEEYGRYTLVALFNRQLSYREIVHEHRRSANTPLLPTDKEREIPADKRDARTSPSSETTTEEEGISFGDDNAGYGSEETY